MIFGRMSNVEKGFANNSDDRRSSDVQFLSRASVKKESRSRPTKNHVANLAPLRFRGYFNNNDVRFVSGRILKGNVNVTSVSTLRATTRPVRANHLFSIPVRSDC